MDALYSTNISANTSCTGIGAGDSINKIELVWILLGTDDTGRTDLTIQANLAASAAAAITAGRSKTLTAGSDTAAIAAFQTTAGTTVAVGTWANGATCVPAVRVTENMSGGGTQAGAWTKGASVTYGTTTTTAAPTTTTTAAPVTFNLTFDGVAGTTVAAYNTGLTAYTAGSGTAALDGSGNLRLNTAAVSDGAIVYRTAAITPTASKTYRWRFKSTALSGLGFWFEIVDDTAKRSPSTGESGTARVRAFLSYNAGLIFNALYVDTAIAVVSWNSSSDSWGGTETGLSITADTYYWLTLVTDATGWQLIIKDANDSVTLKTLPKINWSGVRPFVNSAWLRWGDINTTVYVSDVSIDTFIEA